MTDTTILYTNQRKDEAVLVAHSGKEVLLSMSKDGLRTMLSVGATEARKLAEALLEGAALASPVLREATMLSCDTMQMYRTLVQGTELQDDEHVDRYNAFMAAYLAGRTWVDDSGVTRVLGK